MGATRITGVAIKDATVEIADLSATGTPSSSTFLRGDNTWNAPSIGNITGLGTGIATFLGTPSSANFLSAVTDETGTGYLVFNTNPVLQETVNIWTNISHETSMDGLVLLNTQAGGAGRDYWSPRLRFEGSGVDLSLSMPNTIDFIMELRPFDSLSGAEGSLVTAWQRDGGGFTDVMTLTSLGMLTTPEMTASNFYGNLIGDVTGNATTASALQTARTIGGVSFNGTANITVASATGGFTVSGGNLALGANSLTLTGSIASTGSRVTKGWFTDLEITNGPTIGGTASTGSGGLVRATSPTLVTPVLGTPTSVTLTNATGLPIATGLSGLSAANRIPYSTSATALTTSSNFTYDGTSFTVTLADSTTGQNAKIIGGGANLAFHKDAATSRAWAIGMSTPGNTATNDFVISHFAPFAYSEIARINTSGYFGLGTGATVSYPLQVKKTGVAVTGAWVSSALFSDGSADKGLHLGYSSGEQLGLIVGSSAGSNSGIALWSYNGAWGERMRVHTNGLIGINHTSPVAALDVGALLVGSMIKAGSLEIFETAGLANAYISENSYFDGATFRTRQTGAGQLLALSGGILANFSAPSVTAGSAQTFTRTFWAGADSKFGIGLGLTPSHQLVVGNDLGSLGAVQAVVFGNTSGSMYTVVGQSSTRNVELNWQYNATAASAYAEIVTSSYANPLRIDASEIRFNSQNTGGKIGFFAATAIVQPTTAGAAATFVASAGTTVNDASTFDGYTLKQVVKALRNLGILA